MKRPANRPIWLARHDAGRAPYDQCVTKRASAGRLGYGKRASVAAAVGLPLAGRKDAPAQAGQVRLGGLNGRAAVVRDASVLATASSGESGSRRARSSGLLDVVRLDSLAFSEEGYRFRYRLATDRGASLGIAGAVARGDEVARCPPAASVV